MFSANTNHPIIAQGNEFVLGRKNLSVHSDDRDITKWPQSNSFAINLPEPLLRVQSIQLVDISLPTNYPTFTSLNQNIKLYIELIPTPYLVGHNGPTAGSIESDDYLKIASYLNTQNIPHVSNHAYELSALHQITISEGNYSAEQLANELQFKINKYFECFFKNVCNFGTRAVAEYNYDRFRVVYDNVENRFKFGNTADCFKLYFDKPNEYDFNKNPCIQVCEPNIVWDNNNRWGLGWNLGFNKQIYEANSFLIDDCLCNNYIGHDQTFDSAIAKSPSEMYKPWLSVLPGFSNAFYLCSVKCSNINGETTIYMELDKHNASDELNSNPKCTSSLFNSDNSYGGIINSYFAKIPVFGLSSIDQNLFRNNLFQSNISNNPLNGIQYYYKPEERIEKLKFKFRYHDGTLVHFCDQPFNFSLIFTFLKPDEIQPSNSNHIRLINF
jgi:hypothetical protein